MNSETEYWRIFKFKTADEMYKFEEQFQKFQIENIPKIVPKFVPKPIKVENRGSKTKELHKKIKEYIAKNPNVKYRDALKDYKNIVKQ